MFYERVFREFNKMRVRYVVIGGIALNLHGVPRTTSDLDVAVALEDRNLDKISGIMKDLGFKARLPVKEDEFNPDNLLRWQREKNLRAFTFWNPKSPYEEVDILIEGPVSFNDLDAKKKVVRAGITIPIASMDHLIRLKQDTGRDQDRADVEALEKLMEMK